MFSGIVEEAAKVIALEKDKENLHITMESTFLDELKIDQSVAHNGVCLTVVKLTDKTYTVTAIKETLDRTNLGKLGAKHDDERTSGWSYCAGTCGSDRYLHRSERS